MRAYDKYKDHIRSKFSCVQFGMTSVAYKKLTLFLQMILYHLSHVDTIIFYLFLFTKWK